jgi:hypothetical protein
LPTKAARAAESGLLNTTLWFRRERVRQRYFAPTDFENHVDARANRANKIKISASHHPGFLHPGFLTNAKPFGRTARRAIV